MVQRALGKDQIDEVIRISEMYKSEPSTCTSSVDRIFASADLARNHHLPLR